MACQTYKTEVIVLKKTKLSETDLILTLLNMDGSQIRAVAKGARKPSSVFSSRLELASQVNLLLARGKTLDIIKEVKLIDGFSSFRGDIEKFAAASPALELLYKSSMPDLSNDNLYLPTLKFLQVLDKSTNKELWPVLSAAHLIKICTYLGFRPQMSKCVKCNVSMQNVLVDVDLPLSFSYLDGGLLCRNCAANIQAEKLSAKAAKMIHNLIHMTFEEINSTGAGANKQSTLDVLKFCKLWINCHIGNHMKSLDFYIKNY